MLISTQTKLKKFIRQNFDSLWEGGISTGTKERVNPINIVVREIEDNENLDD